jgi:hypothetical protein
MIIDLSMTVGPVCSNTHPSYNDLILPKPKRLVPSSSSSSSRRR